MSVPVVRLPIPSSRLEWALASVALLSCLSGCGKLGSPAGPDSAASAASAAASAPAKAAVELRIAPEDVMTVGQSAGLGRGALITGAIVPQKRADVRAELGAVVQQVLKENGESVRRGDLLVKLDESTVRDSLNAAEEALRAATLSLEQAERQLQRNKSLLAQGMVSQQAMEDAEQRRNAANTEVLAARARGVAARQQSLRTEVRAPFDGVVVERKVSVGDTVQIGRELLKVMDPHTLRLEGQVSAEQLGEVKPGQKVFFTLNGQGQRRFEGRIQHVDALANPSTRQVQVLVDLVGEKPPVAGLFAEGEVQTTSSATGGKLVLPESAIQQRQGQAVVWRLGGNQRLQRVTVSLGERDARHGWFPVLGGVQAGDRVLRNPGDNLSDGQAYVSVGAGAAGATSAASAAAAGLPASAAK